VTDQNVNVTVKREGCCSGCWGAVLLGFVIALPVYAWENANVFGRIGIIFGGLIVLSLGIWWVVWISKKNNAKAKEGAA
jgi:membrane protein DedA with SNARE-associated domain